jgi:DNA-directed RNA polymerase specialized sigma24 family protein
VLRLVRAERRPRDQVRHGGARQAEGGDTARPRQPGRELRPYGSDDERDRQGQVKGAELVSGMRARVVVMPEDEQRAAFVLTQVLGCSYAETAVICGCPVGTIRSRVARARADLDEMLLRDDIRDRTMGR